MIKIRLILAAIIVAFFSYGCTPIANNTRPDIVDAPEPAAEVTAEQESTEQPAQVETSNNQGNDSGDNEHWGYGDSNGPNEWGDLNSNYHLCKNGKQQSPIDITKTQKAKLSRIAFNYKTGPREIINNGHSVQVNMRKGNSILVSGKRYYLKQIHFHAPSEHLIDGKPADMVAHFVHKAGDGQIAVVAVMMNGCLENSTLGNLWKKLPTKAGGKRKFSKKLAKWIKVVKLIPKNRGYYTYRGSLTTPPCTEDVLWLVMKNAMPVSSGQLKAFTDLYPNNARPVQELNYRVIKSR